MAAMLSASPTSRALHHRKMFCFYLWYSFLLEVVLTPGPTTAEDARQSSNCDDGATKGVLCKRKRDGSAGDPVTLRRSAREIGNYKDIS
jgi:hypothetical protein